MNHEDYLILVIFKISYNIFRQYEYKNNHNLSTFFLKKCHHYYYVFFFYRIEWEFVGTAIIINRLITCFCVVHFCVCNVVVFSKSMFVDVWNVLMFWLDVFSLSVYLFGHVFWLSLFRNKKKEKKKLNINHMIIQK